MLKLCYTGVSFGEAITQLQAEGDDEVYIRIDGKWSEDVKVKIQWPDEHSKMTALTCMLPADLVKCLGYQLR